MKPSQLKKIEYWKKKYCKLIRFRLQNSLDEVYDADIYHYHHIKPKSIYGPNDYLVVLNEFEHCVAHWYLRQYYKYKKDKESFRKMNLAFMSLYEQCGYQLGNVKHRKMFNSRKSILEKSFQMEKNEEACACRINTDANERKRDEDGRV